MADYSAIGLQVISYNESGLALDVTDWLESITPLKTSAIDLIGYVTTTTELLLVNASASNLETRFKPRWAPGNKIEIYVTTSTGALVLHRTLRILSALFDQGRSPTSPRQGIPSLTLELGDIFTWRDRRTPPPGKVKIPRVDPFEEITIVSQVSAMLQAFGLPPVTVLPGDETPPETMVINVEYKGGSPIMSHIGQFLYLNSRFVLWVDPQERVRLRRVGQRVDGYDFNNPASQISFTTYAPSFFGLNSASETGFVAERTRSYRSYTESGFEFQPVAQSELAFELTDADCLINERSLSEREKAAGLIQVAGTARYRDYYEDPGPLTSTENNDEIRTTETLTTDTSFVFETQTFRKDGTVVIPGLAEAPDVSDPDPDPENPEDPPPVAIAPEEPEDDLGQYTEIDKFEYGGGLPSRSNPNPLLEDYPGLADHLQKRTLTVREQRRETDGSLSAKETTKQEITTYTYRYLSDYIQGVKVTSAEVERIRTVTRVRPEVGGAMVTREVRTQVWTELAEGVYHYSDRVIRPADTENRRYVRTQNSVGRSTPPSTQFFQARYVNKDRQIYAQFALNYPPDTDGLDRVRTYNTGPYLDSNRAAAVLAKHLGALLVGRDELQNLAFRATDAWLADPIPAPYVAVDDALYVLDIPVLLVEKKRCYLGGSGIFMGAWDNTTNTLTPPYTKALELWAYDADTLVVDENLDPVSI